MDALERLGLANEAGQGVDRMMFDMKKCSYDYPEFEEREGSFLVRLRLSSSHDQ
jgi:predicted HTH transcriptional regulator